MTSVRQVAARPPAPRLGAAARAAAIDIFYNSWRLVPANLLWGAGLIALLLLGEVGAPFLSIVLSPLLALPTIGLYRMAGLVVRGESVSFSDGLDAWQRFGRRGLVLGAILAALGTIFGVNVLTGVAQGEVLGWALATTAAWGLVVTGMAACVVWPLAVDPRRQDESLRSIIRLALLLVIAFPLRLGRLTVLVAVVLIGSAIGFAALLTVSMAFVALLSARFVLPAADRFAPPDGEA